MMSLSGRLEEWERRELALLVEQERAIPLNKRTALTMTNVSFD
jgi:hypothetical protein